MEKSFQVDFVFIIGYATRQRKFLMRNSLIQNLFFLLLFFQVSNISFGQLDSYAYNNWTWMKGDSISNVQNVYGNQGIAAVTNKPCGRLGSISWTDLEGNLWLFGGETAGNNNCYNDLWKYNPITNLWTWVKGDSTVNVLGVYGSRGVAAETNKPGSRIHAVSWTDISGNLWLYGGANYVGSVLVTLSDLWKFNISSNLWTWVKGDSIPQGPEYGLQGFPSDANTPGAKWYGVSWTDNAGNLWLFGSQTIGGPIKNDLWKYDPLINQWTWVNGDNSNIFGVYGIKGIAASTNRPGGRYRSVSWKDSNNNLWLFGGLGRTANTSISSVRPLNDLWKYNISSNQWTWMNGDSTTDALSVYGLQGVPDTLNNPGAKYESISWTDNSGNFWIFGGAFPFNDLWKYDPITNLWTWVKGRNFLGVYGTQGVESPGNLPSGRYQGVAWKDNFSNLYLFGGFGFRGSLNDLWKIYGGIPYVFTGNGDWDIPTNWFNGIVGPKNIPTGVLVIIDNFPTGQCDVNGNINIQPFGQLSIYPTKKLNIINGNLTNAGLLNGNGTLSLSGSTLNSISSSGSIFPPLQLFNKQAFLTGIANTKSIQLLNGSHITLNGFDLRMDTGNLVADDLNYFITNSTGRLNRFVTTTPVLFAVGKSDNSYTPATIINAGVSDHFGVRVEEGVPTTIPIPSDNVNRTWHIQENIAGGSDASVTLQWNSPDELTSFNRTRSYISHYQVCPPPLNCDVAFWDAVSPANASGTGPEYTQLRTNVRSFNTSSFVVTSQDIVFTFNNATGNSNWFEPRNWMYERIPPALPNGQTQITAGMHVVIDPATGQCNYNGTVNVLSGGKLTVRPGKIFNLTQ